MDFLLLFSGQDSVVIEVDGFSTIPSRNGASPTKYGELVSADRALRIIGFKVYRFGGAELRWRDAAEDLATEFLDRLLTKQGIRGAT